MASHFFSEHPQFFETSPVGNWPDRLNARYDAIIRDNAAIFAGARVLDIASHDGRWSFAALHAGASHVTGIEVRPELTDAARSTLPGLGYGPDRFEGITGDIFSRPDIFRRRFDVVMCLGFLYHTTRHEETFELISQTQARTVIIDTRLTPGDGCYTVLRKEAAEHPANGMAERGVRDGMILNAWPTRDAVSFALDHFGYDVRLTDWPALLASRGLTADPTRDHAADNPVGDYAAGARGTFTATLR